MIAVVGEMWQAELIVLSPTELYLEHAEIVLRPDLAERLHPLRDGIDVLARQSCESEREQRLPLSVRCGRRFHSSSNS